MDSRIIFRCNDCDVIFPKSFAVRKYDNKLNYSVHNVIRYYTINPQTFVYCMMRSTEKVIVRVDNEKIVAMNDRIGQPKYIRFSHGTPVDKLVCEMFTKKDSLVVLDRPGDTTNPTLF